MEISSTLKNTYRYSEMLAMAYMSVLLASLVLTRKFFHTPFGMMSAASLISPFWFIIGDIIAEVYGFAKARYLFFTAIIFQLLFSFLLASIAQIHSESESTNYLHLEMFGHLAKLSLLLALFIIVGWRINIYLLLRWKFLVKGRYFWLRSLGSSTIGMTIYSALIIFTTLITIQPIDKILEVIIHSCCLKVIAILLLAYPSQLIADYLKRAEGVDFYEKVKFNPFTKENSEESFVTTGYATLDHHRIFYKYYFSTEKISLTPTIFLPGGPGISHELYEKNLNFVTKLRNVIFFDPLGTGKSDSLASKDYSLSYYIKTVNAVLNHLNIDKAILLGSSYGSFAALNFAINYPGQVSGLMLSGVIASHHFKIAAIKELQARGTSRQIELGEKLMNGTLKHDEVDEYFSTMQSLYSTKPLNPDSAPVKVPCSFDVLHYGFTHCLNNLDFRKEISSINVPCLLLTGEKDWITPPSQAEEVHKLIKNSRLVIVPNTGHGVSTDAPDIYQTEISSFLDNQLAE